VFDGKYGGFSIRRNVMEDEESLEFWKWKCNTLEELISVHEASIIEFEAAKDRLINAKQSLKEARAFTLDDYFKQKQK
jgi:hypothetical protein